MTLPKPEEIELTVFGPGYGECIVIHVGSNKWVIFDSCLDDTRQPAALTYLHAIGVNVAKDVAAVVATHWHDDHIRGLCQTLEACSNAVFAASAALRNDEFRAFLKVHDNQPVAGLDRGGTEILKCMLHVQSTGRRAKPIFHDVLIFDWDRADLAHGRAVQVRALSPSARQFDDHLVWVASFLREAPGMGGSPKRQKKRIAGDSKNDLSIAALLHFEDASILLGADVEERGDPELGWSAIVNSRRGRRPQSSVFKVAHHGSVGAHLDDVWSEILQAAPISIVTPWQKGGMELPTPIDRQRLARLSGAAFVTSTEKASIKKRYDRDVLKLVKHASVDLKSALFRSGRVSIRIDPLSGATTSVDLSGGARKL